jgi:hypothetical protein
MEQVCIGPQGHAPVLYAGNAILIPLDDYRTVDIPQDDHPPFVLRVNEAVDGQPCFGTYRDPETGETFHTWSAILYDPTRRAQAPPPLGDPNGHPWVAGYRHQDGIVRQTVANIDHGTSIDEVQRLLTAWADITGPRGPLKLDIGHPPEPDTPRDEYMAVWREVRPQYQKRGLVPALAARLVRHPTTIRNYHKKYGYPLYENVEDVE